jgi:hypothetical protein
MKNLLTFARVLSFIGLVATIYFLFIEFPVKDIKQSNSFLIATLFLIIGFIMSFKRKIYRESGAILIIGGIVVGFYYFTRSSSVIISILYSMLFIVSGAIFWLAEKNNNQKD